MCPHAKEHPTPGVVTCEIGEFGGEPHAAVCKLSCKKNPDPESWPLINVGIIKRIPVDSPTPGETILVVPCGNCGDKTNIAQLKSDPAAIERMLSGE